MNETSFLKSFRFLVLVIKVKIKATLAYFVLSNNKT